MKVYFSHLRHLELTHRKLTHMYMFLMMSGIFLQHFQLIKPCYTKKWQKCKKCIQTYTFLSFYESVFSHLRHLELTHRKLTHMYMFLMMSGIFLQHFQLIKPCYTQKMAKNVYKLILFCHSMKVYFSHVILCFIFYRT